VKPVVTPLFNPPIIMATLHGPGTVVNTYIHSYVCLVIHIPTYIHMIEDTLFPLGVHELILASVYTEAIKKVGMHNIVCCTALPYVHGPHNGIELTACHPQGYLMLNSLRLSLII